MAKVLYCWRCQMEIPMLEEHEWKEVLPLLEQRREDKGQAARVHYKKITGFDEPNPVAIWHHRVSLFGPPCTVCGKPLRTPRAKLCAECGHIFSRAGNKQLFEAKVPREDTPKPFHADAGNEEPPTMRDVRSSPTVKDLLIARTLPWNRVAPIVINTILETITDKGLLEAFVMHSMNAGLVARYEALGWEDSDSTVIRTQISQILCETGNRVIPELAKALATKQTDAATKAIMLAGDTFEAAIALAKNQIAAYAGMAALYGLVGKRAESHNYAKLGLSELEKMRRDPAAQALRDSTIFPADILDQTERQLRTYLEI